MISAADPVTDVIVVAAGSGTRLGAAVPKAFLEIAGAPLLSHAMRHLAAINARLVVITVPADEPEHWRDFVSRLSLPGEVEAVPGGDTRQDSVRIAMCSLARRYEEGDRGRADVVVVHDAARPCTSLALWRSVRDAAARSGAAIPVLPAIDCLKRINSSGQVVETLDRATVAHAQTPQAFRFDWLWAAHQEPGRSPAADDAELVERLGHTVSAVPGETTNLKVTTVADLEIARSLLERTVT
jgi:2-C-methyl-D-erythritol 4-phosphate cytidylyltransferase